jgi:hypothetical protein
VAESLKKKRVAKMKIAVAVKATAEASKGTGWLARALIA